MLQKVLLPTDGSQSALKAASIALEFAQNNMAEVEILFVSPFTLYSSDEEYPVSQVSLHELAQQVVDKTAEEFLEKGVPYTSRIEMGDAADQICQVAEDANIQLIIMGTRGQTGINRFLIGSVSAKVIRHAPCSVLIVR